MADPRAEYRRRLDAHTRVVEQKERLHVRFGNAKLAVVLVFLVLIWLYFAGHRISGYWVLAPIICYAALAVLHEYALRARSHAESAAAFYRSGIGRIEDRWAGSGATGERFRDLKHVYAEDLDLFGRASLFELLSTARSPMGENRLAQWLLDPSSLAAILERQELVGGLREHLDLREDLAVVGEDLRIRLDPESLIAWCEARPLLGGAPLRTLAAILVLAAAGTLVYFFFTGVVRPLLAVLLIELVVYTLFRKRAEDAISRVNCNAEGVELFSQLVARLEREPFSSPRLQQLAAQLTRDGLPASQALDKFSRLVHWIDARGSLIARILNLPFLYTLQTALAAEAWRKRHGERMRIWVDVTAEFEALLSLSAFAFEHPTDPFPEFVEDEESPALFEGAELGHPLIAAAPCVRNNVHLNASERVWLVSGSNMSGKSTLLRTVGVNTVLAMAGAPIRGKSLRLTPVALGTRLRSIDSLQEARSTFFTEVLHIRQVFGLLSDKTRLLFLFDELLEGTNSNDRRIGAEGLLRALLESGAIGIVTTHDLALTGMTAALGASVRNLHFQDYVEEGKMRFDYKLRDGVVAKSNALELMRMVGLKV